MTHNEYPDHLLVLKISSMFVFFFNKMLPNFLSYLSSIAEKRFDIWGILKMAIVNSVEPGNNLFYYKSHH